MQLKHTFLFFMAKDIFISLVDGYLTLSALTSVIKYNASEMPPSPNFGKGIETPLNVIVSIGIENVGLEFGVDEDFLVVDLKLKLSWYDSRLNYIDKDLQTYIYTKDEKAIWTPYLVWVTERSAKTSTPYTFFRIYPNSLVTEFIHASVKIKRLHNAAISGGFSVRLLTLNHTKESVALEWNETNPLEITDEFLPNWPEFLTKGDFQARTCHVSVARLSKKQGGDHSCLEISVERRIHKSSAIFIVYIPGIALVIISWACFWMDPSSELARAAVLLACLLHLCIQKIAIVKNLVLLKNVMSLTSFIDGCLGFIFAAFFETIWITYLQRTTGKPGATRLSSATTIQEEEEEGIVESSDGEANTLCNHFHFPRIWLNRFPSTPDAINAICRVGFPLCFVIFVCAFFAVKN